MAELHIVESLGDKVKEIQAYMGSPEINRAFAHRELSAIAATGRVFQSRGPKVTAHFELAALLPRHEPPGPANEALTYSADCLSTVRVATAIDDAGN